jgi:hypothetical protein
MAPDRTPDQTPAYWVAWDTQALHLYLQQAGGAVHETTLPRAMPADYRYFLRLYHLDNGSRWLKSCARGKTVLEQVAAAGQVQPVRGWPGELGELPIYRIFPFPDGVVVGIRPDMQQLVLWRAGQAPRILRAPEGLLVSAVARDRKQRLLVAGAGTADALRTLGSRRAYASSADDGTTWRLEPPAPSGLRTAWFSLLSQAEAGYRTIDSVDNFLVLSAQTDNEEHPATVLYVRTPGGRWRSGVIKDDVLRTVLPAPRGQVQAFFHYGRIVTIGSDGSWHNQSLATRIAQVLQGESLPPDLRYELLSAQVGIGGAQILTVSLRSIAEGRLKRFGEAVVAFTERGDRLLALHRAEQPEIMAAGW